MKESTLNVAQLMRAGDVKRWHTVPTVRPQTLAEHQYNVLVLALGIALGAGEAAHSEWLAKLAFEAVFHDAEEAVSGDVPAPLKTDSPPAGDIAKIVWVADALEAYWWINFNGHGFGHPDVVNDCLMRLKRRVKQSVELELGAWLVTSVNELMHTLCLPGRV